jgi:heme-degrading monooxygenase HmoA
VYWVVWSFDVKVEQVKAFERAYGPDGEWERLFRLAPGYAGTELRQETDRRGHYLTIDRWNSRADYERFKDTFSTQYQMLDVRCARLTEIEKKVGDFETQTGEREAGSGRV